MNKNNRHYSIQAVSGAFDPSSFTGSLSGIYSPPHIDKCKICGEEEDWMLDEVCRKCTKIMTQDPEIIKRAKKLSKLDNL